MSGRLKNQTMLSTEEWVLCPCLDCKTPYGKYHKRYICPECDGMGSVYKLVPKMRTKLGDSLSRLSMKIKDKKPAWVLMAEMKSRR